MFGPIPSTNTNRLASSPFGTIGFQAASNHKANSTAPIIHFLAEAQSLPQPPEGKVAKGRAGYVLQEARSLADDERRKLLYVLFDQVLGGLVRLAGAPSAAVSSHTVRLRRAAGPRSPGRIFRVAARSFEARVALVPAHRVGRGWFQGRGAQ